jgi:Ca2+-binding EF-hand superfamily protein
MVEFHSDVSAESVVAGRKPDILHVQDEVLLAWQSGNMKAGDLSGTISDESILANLTLYDSAAPSEAGMLAYAQTRFDDMDADGDGHVAAEEIETFRTSGTAREEEMPYLRMLQEQSADLEEGYDDENFDENNGYSRNDLLKKGGHTELTAAHIQFAQNNFSTLDRDGDLEITADELTEVLREHGGDLSARDEMSLAALRMNAEELESMVDDDGWDGGISAMDLAAKGNEMPYEDFSVPGDSSDSADDPEIAAAAEAAAADEGSETEGAAATEESYAGARSLAILGSEASSIEEQLGAVKSLFEAGQSTATITDASGNTLTLRFDMQPVAEGSDRQFLHVFSVDESGRERVVLRAIAEGDGFSQQRDANGEFVPYTGSSWQKEYPDSIFNQ